MARAQLDDTVRIHYTGKLEDGSIIDSSVDRDPLQLTIGKGEVIPGIEETLTGMEPGETKTTTLSPDQAFGERRDDLVTTVERRWLPADLEPSPGQKLQVPRSDGKPITVTVTDVNDATVTVDANHPLAGRPLVFEVQLVEIV